MLDTEGARAEKGGAAGLAECDGAFLPLVGGICKLRAALASCFTLAGLGSADNGGESGDESRGLNSFLIPAVGILRRRK